VNCLRDIPMTQFSIPWILSLNHLSHFWGQVQSPTCLLTSCSALGRKPLKVLRISSWQPRDTESTPTGWSWR